MKKHSGDADYRAIFDSVNDLIVVHECETGRPVDINRKVVETFGWSREEYLRLRVEDWSLGEPPFDQEEALRRIRKAAEGEPQLFEWLCKDKEGRLFWVEVNLKRAVIGEKERVLAVVRDIDKRKQVEEQLAQKTEDLTFINTINDAINRNRSLDEVFQLFAEGTKRIFSSSGADVYLLNEKGDFLDRSQVTLSSEIKAKIEEVIGMKIPEVGIPLRPDSRYFEILKSGKGLVISDSGQMMDFMMEHAGNEGFRDHVPAIFEILGYKSMVVVPLPGMRETIGLVTMSSRSLLDESDMHRLQLIVAQLGHLFSRKKMEEKRAELLRHIAAANRELEDFAYIVSHDLKAPLRGISSLATWLSSDYRDRLDEKGREMLDLLVGRSRHMHDLINSILDYSRITRFGEKKMDVDLNLVVEDVIGNISPPEDIDIKTVSRLPVVLCEKTRVTQVVQNLVENAVLHMDKPDGEVRIGCREKGDMWEIYVSDNGPGIKKEYFGKVFQLFQKLQPDDDRGNTGVGLAVVKKIVEQFGGEVGVESEPGKGSSFFFTIPKHDSGKATQRRSTND